MISGAIKFFDRSKCLVQDDTTIVASSGTDAAERCLDRNPISYWRSVSSDDTVLETLEVSFSESMTFDRLFLQDHNFKEYTVQYFNGSIYVDFTNVVGIDGSTSGIDETAYARDTSYYEFDEVSSTKILISVLKTQVVNAQKYLNQVIVTSELGTLQGYPLIKGTEISRNLRVDKTLSGRASVNKDDDFFKVQLDFKDYPASLSNDIDLIFSLHDFESTFLIWLCGGKTGSNFFRKQMRGYRLRDVISVQMIQSLKPIYSDNVYVNSVNFSAAFQEAID